MNKNYVLLVVLLVLIISCTTYWVDPKERLVCLLFLQQSPFRHSEIHDKFKAMVYQALND